MNSGQLTDPVGGGNWRETDEVTIPRDYTEEFLQAIDLMIKTRLQDVKFDTTIECIILDDTEAETNYRYWVSNGSAKFYAYSESKYYVDDTVYVSIPNNDYNDIKIIIGKKVNNATTPYKYTKPFDTFIDVTGNVIQGTTQASLIANDPNPHEILIWEWSQNTTDEQDAELNACPYNGFNRIGIKAQFQSLLQQYEVLGGKYGLRLKIQSNRPDMDAEKIDKLLHPDDPQKDPVPKEQVIFTDILDFSNDDMYGNTYNFESYYEQEKLWFIVQDLGEIKKLELYFYEEPHSFIYKNEMGEEKEIPWQSDADFLQSAVTKVNPNLFIKDVYLSFGLSLDNFDGNELLLYSPDNKKYKNTEKYNDSTNIKRLFLRWIYQDPDTSVIREGTIDDLVDNKERHDWIRWYRYDFGKGSADEHSGVYWSFWPSKDEYNFFTAELAPDTSRKIESIKCIASINGQIYKSNVLDFTTSDDLEDPATVLALTDFDIICDDGTFGNYYIYQLGGSLIDSTQRNIERSLSWRLEHSKPDTNAIQKIVWKVPIQNTMIKISDTTKNLTLKDEHYTYTETPQDKPEYAIITFDLQGKRECSKCTIENDPPLTLNYFINPLYNASNNNNSIECTITTYGKSYHAERVLRFGTAGTSGTDVTLTIDMEPGRAALRNFNPATTENDNIDTVKVTAHLYDADNHLINLDDHPDLVYTWDWVNPDYTIFTIDPSNPEDQTYECNIQLPNTFYQDSPKAHCSILRLKVEKWGNSDLIAYLPIPLQQSVEGEKRDLHIVGPTEIWYDSEGTANYYKQPYLLMPIGASSSDAWDVLWGIRSLEWADDKWPLVEKFYPTLSKKDMLIPLGIYMEGYTNNICLTAYTVLKDAQGIPIPDSEGNKQRDEILWQQPILIYQNRYPAAMLNGWDGQLEIDKTNGSIMAPVIAAGRKDGDNTFSGVVIGAVDSRLNAESALTRQTGVYGYHQGKMSYAFKEDGTAFIGKDGSGRIIFDGTNATISSASYTGDNPRGMQIDLNHGTINMILGSGYQEVIGLTSADFTDDNKDKYYKYVDYQLNTSKPETEKEKEKPIYYLPLSFNEISLTSNTYIANKYFIKKVTTETVAVDENSSEQNSLSINRTAQVEDNTYTIYQIINITISDYTENGKAKKKRTTVTTEYTLATKPFESGVTYVEPISFSLATSDELSEPDIVPYYYIKITSYVNCKNDPVFDPMITYYTLAANTQRYISLDADTKSFPLAIGTSSSPSDRNFRVDWDGTAYINNGIFSGVIKASGGTLSGDLRMIEGGTIYGGTISGADIYTNYLFCNYGDLGGWTVNSNSLFGGQTILHSTNGIITNKIIINDVNGEVDINGIPRTEDLGTVGLVLGSEPVYDDKIILNDGMGGTGVQATYNIGIFSGTTDSSIILQTKKNIALRYDKTTSGVLGDLYINMKHIYCDVLARDQHGIYARFA